jgi:hypothetical protein
VRDINAILVIPHVVSGLCRNKDVDARIKPAQDDSKSFAGRQTQFILAAQFSPDSGE